MSARSSTSRDDYEFVVIGGGSGGSVVAGRLAEAGHDVLVLEAGGTDRRPDVLIPAGVMGVYRYCNWKYVPEPDPSRHGVQEAWAAGRILGGGGSINATVFVRGNAADFDSWAQRGCQGWDFASVLPHFRRMETWEDGADAFRGGSGPIAVERHSMHHPANDAFTVAAHECGHAKLADYNGAEQVGVGHVQVNQHRGVRCQASRAYLRPRPARHHVTIRTKAFVRRIVFDGERAIGVEYEHRGRRRIARAAREVVLSAGAIASPKILMVSGIGPREHLEPLGIDVVRDLPGVGANLQEHIAVMQRWHATVPTINTMGPVGALRSVGEYIRHRTGTLAATVCHVQVMHRLRDTSEAPDAQLTFASFATLRDVDPDGILKVQPAREDGFLVTTLFLHPRVRGRIRLRSAAPDARPVIDHALVGDPDDLRGVLTGMAEARRIMAAPAMTGLIGAPFDPEAGCRTEDDWEEFVRANVTYGAHPVGTCRMGTDGEAVVEPDLRVKGTSGLRVIDASVMPTVTSGNTNAPTMMIGEKGAELLLNT